MNSNPYLGSSLDELLEEDNILAEVDAIALKRVHAWQIKQQQEVEILDKQLPEVSITENEIEVWNLKQNLAWQIEQAMKERELTKTELENQMSVSSNALNRLLDPYKTSINLNIMQRAASVLGKQFQINLVNDKNYSPAEFNVMSLKQDLAWQDAMSLKQDLVWQIEQAIKKKGLTKIKIENWMKISPITLNRLLDPADTSLNLARMQEMAKVLNMRLQLNLVAEKPG